jgi:rhomboid family GlyGly-CTERM serine protease
MQILRRVAHWRLPLALALFSAIAAAFGTDAQEFLRYERAAIASGEIWRLVSGHLVHLGNPHLLMNLAGLLLVWLLVGRLYSTRDWLLAAAFSILAMDAGLWFLDPDIRWYVGLSGLLHGLLAAGAIGGFRALPGESVVIGALIAAKVGYEQLVGPLPGSESTAGGAVVVNAHLYGALGGVLFALLFRRRVRTPGSI